MNVVYLCDPSRGRKHPKESGLSSKGWGAKSDQSGFAFRSASDDREARHRELPLSEPWSCVACPSSESAPGEVTASLSYYSWQRRKLLFPSPCWGLWNACLQCLLSCLWLCFCLGRRSRTGPGWSLTIFLSWEEEQNWSNWSEHKLP